MMQRAHVCVQVVPTTRVNINVSAKASCAFRVIRLLLRRTVSPLFLNFLPLNIFQATLAPANAHKIRQQHSAIAPRP